MKKYYNQELEKAVNLAKSLGFKVWTFENNKNVIESITIDNGKTYGHVYAQFSSLNYSTCHEPSKDGTGYSIKRDAFADIELIKDTLCYAPFWAISSANRVGIVKKSFADHIKSKNCLKYYEL